jgi:MFS transporter, PAT family, beta-lactamase induction signal transducer AmpG
VCKRCYYRPLHARFECGDLTAARKPTLIEALGDKRMLAILLLSVASGLPFLLTSSTLQAWLADSKIDIKTIGIFSLVGLPYILKFLWAPLLDRYLPPLLGRRRGWILIFQLALCVAIAVMGTGSPTTDLPALAAMAFIVVFLSASQDVVINAYTVDVIPPSERALVAVATSFGFRTAAIFAGAVLLSIAHFLGWQQAYLLVAALMLCTTFATFHSPEPEVAGLPPQTLANAVVHPFKDLLSRHGAWGFLLLVLLYKVGDAFALSLYSAFMIKGVGFSLNELAYGGKVNMTVSTMAGVAIGGWLYMRLGMFRSLLIFGIGQACTNLMYMWLALAGKKFWLLVLATSVDTSVGGMGQAAFVGFLISQCSPSFSATQYALLSALAAVPRIVFSSTAGYVVDAVGWSNFFVVTFLAATPGLALLLFLRPLIYELEARDAGGGQAQTPARETTRETEGEPAD